MVRIVKLGPTCTRKFNSIRATVEDEFEAANLSDNDMFAIIIDNMYKKMKEREDKPAEQENPIGFKA
jgi:hypothetical protein